MSSIRDTVETALKERGVHLSPQYQQYADWVVAALQSREDEVVSNLVAFATDKGLDRDSALQGIADCGLYVQMSAVDTDEDPRIADMERQIEEMQATLRSMRGQ